MSQLSKRIIFEKYVNDVVYILTYGFLTAIIWL